MGGVGVHEDDRFGKGVVVLVEVAAEVFVGGLLGDGGGGINGVGDIFWSV